MASVGPAGIYVFYFRDLERSWYSEMMIIPVTLHVVVRHQAQCQILQTFIRFLLQPYGGKAMATRSKGIFPNI